MGATDLTYAFSGGKRMENAVGERATTLIENGGSSSVSCGLFALYPNSYEPWAEREGVCMYDIWLPASPPRLELCTLSLSLHNYG